MSKRVILSGFLALAFALSLSTSAYAKLEDKDIYFGGGVKETAAEFVQMRIRGKLTELPSLTVPTTLTITAAGKPYLIDVTDKTIIVRRYNGKSTLTEFVLGDDVEVIGKAVDSGNIKATVLKNHTIYLTSTKGLFGDIKSIDTVNNSLVFTWKDKDYNVKVDADTKIIIPGIKEKAAITDLEVGDRVLGRAVYNTNNQTYLAKIMVVVRRDLIDLLKKKAKTVNKEGRLSKIISTALPATLEMIKDGKIYKINVTDKTVIVRKHFGKSSLSEFRVGDKIRVIGAFKADTMTIDAKVLKNDSLKSLNELTVDGDQDGLPDARDEKLNDHDNDGIIDRLDADDDNDGTRDFLEKLINRLDHDNDGVKDAKDKDDDNDGIKDEKEARGKRFDHDNDGSEDMKDTDDDDDGILDVDESLEAWDHDNDSKRDDRDDDDDNDGIRDDDEDEGEVWDHDNDGADDDDDDDDDNDNIKDDEDTKPHDSDNDGIEDKDKK